MKKSLPVILLLALLLSCKDKEVSPPEMCGVKDPVRNIDWLNKLINDAKKTKEDQMLTIVAVNVKGKTVINYYISYMSCVGCISYNCDGSLYDRTELTPDESKEYQNNIWGENGKRVVLWPEK